MVVGAVGDVDVGPQIGLPRLDGCHHGSYLGRIELGEIAVQVEVAGVGAPAHLGRAALIDAGKGRGAFMTVDVENGYEEQIDPLEKLAESTAHGQISQQHEPGILAIDLTAVNAGLREEDGPTVGVQLRR